MGSYLVGRLAQFVPTLFLVSVVVFFMVRAIPGDAAHVLLGPTAKPALQGRLVQRAQLEKRAQLARPADCPSTPTSTTQARRRWRAKPMSPSIRMAS